MSFINIFKIIQSCIKYSDKFLWGIIITISLYSLLLVASVSRVGFNYFTVQFVSIIIGLLGATALQAVNYKSISKVSKWIAVVGIILIVYTLFAGVAVEGHSGVNARAWIKLPGGITFQPSELVKIGFVVTFATHIDRLKKTEQFDNIKQMGFLALHVLVPVILTHLQGDDGAAIIFLCIAKKNANESPTGHILRSTKQQKNPLVFSIYPCVSIGKDL